MLLEVIATTLDQALQAERMGAGRLELVMGIKEGGLTPSLAMVAAIKEQVRIPVAVMIRPHSQSFRYTEGDIAVMRQDIENFKALGVDSFVLGALDGAGRIDLPVMHDLLSAVGETPVVFHRAFDETPSAEQSLETLSTLPQVKRLLTSFGADYKLDDLDRLRALTKTARDQGLTLLWGGAVTKDNLSIILREIVPSEVHVGSAVRWHNQATADLDPEAMTFFLNSLSGN